AFTVEGFTARGTPIPPGFYNLAYYNQYLRDGGTPLEGFPQLAAGATINETYGKFGDGATRATRFIAATPDGGDTPSSAPGTVTSPFSGVSVDPIAQASEPPPALPTTSGAAPPP